MSASDDSIRNIIVIGDTHCGSSVGLLPPGVEMDEGKPLPLNPTQEWLWESWNNFWAWAYGTLGSEPFALVHIGDMIDGRHHGTTQLASGNLSVQARIAVAALQGPVNKATKTFFIRGTEAHVGQSAEFEEMTARQLVKADEKSKPVTRWDLWVELGADLIHFAHHISTTSSHAYKSSPLMRLMAASFGAAGEHGFKPPTIMVRGHCHDYTEVKRAHCRVVTCPCWQTKTGFVWKFATIEPVVVGGLLIRSGKDGVHIRERLYTEPRQASVRL